jgi:hypothetical protein
LVWLCQILVLQCSNKRLSLCFKEFLGWSEVLNFLEGFGEELEVVLVEAFEAKPERACACALIKVNISHLCRVL